MSKNETQMIVMKRGVGFVGYLTLIFVVAKLLKLVDWSWWLVFIPLWGPFAAIGFGALAVFVGAFIIYFGCEVYDRIRENIAVRKRRKAVAKNLEITARW